MERNGYFSEEGFEYVVSRPDTPRAFDNFLWNDAVMSNVQQTGVGYLDYQIADTEAIQLFTGNGRVCDFDIFGRDTLMSRLIYIKDMETGEYWNANWEPVCAEYDEYKCVHGLGYTEISNSTNGVCSKFNIFVPTGSDPVELWRLKLSSADGRKRSLRVFVYCQFQFRYKWGFDSYGDMLFRNSGFSNELNSVIVSKHPHIKPHTYLSAFLTADRKASGYDGTREAFVGTYGSLNAPDAVIRGECSGTPGSSDATVGVLQFDIELNSGTEEISIMVGAFGNGEYDEVKKLRCKYIGKNDYYLNQLKQSKDSLMNKYSVKTPDKHLNRMVNYWMKEQALFGARWCRWGWNGYRDIVQHGMGVSAILPERTREILFEALKYQYSNGMAVRGWNPIDTKPYSDSALWLIFTLTSYIKETDDTDILKEKVKYFDEGEGTVFEHIMKALDFLEEHKGAHGLCLIKFGDWNDSLTAVGKNGKGESTWLTEAYAEALRNMAELSEYLGATKETEMFLSRREAVVKSINATAWDGDWYIRCFDDFGETVGGKANEQGKMFGEAQAWALLSNIASRERAGKLISACDEMLATPMGYRLLTPTFTKMDERVGRLSSMEPGICENGTIYTHVNAWFILGLLRNGETEKAYELFKKITVGYEDMQGPREKCPPYVYANCFFGPDHKNNAYQMEFTWVTGSISWLNRTIVEEMLGVKPEYNKIRIAPSAVPDWENYTCTKQYQNATYSIEFHNPEHLGKGTVKITVDGNEIDGDCIPSFRDGKNHLVKVEILKEQQFFISGSEKQILFNRQIK